MDLFTFPGEAGDRIELELLERARIDDLPANAGLFGPLGSAAWLQQSPLLGRLATMLTASGPHVLELQTAGAYSLELAGVEHARFEAEPNDERASTGLFGAGRAAGHIDPPGEDRGGMGHAGSPCRTRTADAVRGVRLGIAGREPRPGG